jgi:hypothetical protein
MLKPANNMPAIVQIVPRRTVQPEGIGDYATLLANALFERSGCRSVFLVGTPAEIEPPVKDAWDNSPVTSQKGSVLSKQLTEVCRETEAKAVLLHVSGYGYQKRGVPFWLLRGIQEWRRVQPRTRLVGIFHELYATGHLRNSSFWLSRAQRYVTSELWRLCDNGLTTNDAYFCELAAWRRLTGNQLKVLPVSSNVGEPDTLTPLLNRPIQMAVFGGPGVEEGVYSSPVFERSAEIANALGIETVIDIGGRVTSVPARLGNAVVKSVGRLSRCLVSRHLLGCRYGLLNYDVGRLGKSGVFAAYAAHGVIPICIGSRAAPTNELEAGRHFLRWPFNRSSANLPEIQANLIRWYHDHSIAKHADVLDLLCTEKSNSYRCANQCSARSA